MKTKHTLNAAALLALSALSAAAPAAQTAAAPVAEHVAEPAVRLAYLQQRDVQARSLLFPAFGKANAQFAAAPGPYGVATDAVVGDCRGLVGLIAKLVLLDAHVQCDAAFPYGFQDPISTSVYYPRNIGQLGKLPVVVFAGGILSNPGQYAAMVQHWASQGVIVMNVGDFINSTPVMPLLGLNELIRMDRDPQSPLFGKVDLARTLIAGHSAGGQAAIQTGSFPPQLQAAIDPRLRIVGVLPIEPGPLGLSATLQAPALILTGAADTVVPAIAWPNLWQDPQWQRLPAWGATARFATHFSPVRELKYNEFGGITTAFVRYVLQDDAAAKAYFVGANYKLSLDEQFVPSAWPVVGVDRNRAAAELK